MNYSALRQFHDDIMAQADTLCPARIVSDLDLRGHRGKFRQAVVHGISKFTLGDMYVPGRGFNLSHSCLRSYAFWLDVRKRFLELGGDYQESARPMSGREG